MRHCLMSARPMDLRAQQTSACPSTASKDATPYCSTDDVYLMNAQDRLLAAGTMIAAEARKALKNEAGFRCSAGIASNRLLAKLASGLHKPDDQTIILPSQASAFVGPLAVRAIPGVGHKLEAQLTEMGMRVVEDLRKMNETDLIRCFGDRTGAFLHKACWGCDPTPVQERGPPKSITVEESFKSCTTLAAAPHVGKSMEENQGWPVEVPVEAFVGQAGLLGLPAVADQQTANQHSRRDYGGVPRAGILSKRLEREVREHDRLPEEAAVTDIHNGDTGAADAKKAKLGAVKVDTGVEGWPLGSPRDDAHCQQASAGWAELVLKQAGSLRCQHDLITNLEDDGASMQAPTSTHDCSLRTWASSPAVDGTNEVATANDQDARNRVGSRNDSGSTSRLGAPASTSDNCPPAWGIDCSSGLAHGLDPSRSHNGVLQPVSISCGPASRQQSLLDSLNSRATSFSKETERPQHPRPGSSGFAHHEVLTLKRMAANGELSQGCGGRGGRCQEARTDYEMAVKLQREELGIGRHMDSKISNSNGSKQSSRGLTKSGKGPMDSFLIRR
ncbi:unnamed protein product [Ostreobium quekettii]|uniref:UmuC domain-containing protein n=1 Tax=Ostreobium quekettii TaxID=121088 RepID=A0A8S1IT86_9CHLO|nr:unnamed protein product [Ostreobium quekettii]